MVNNNRISQHPNRLLQRTIVFYPLLVVSIRTIHQQITQRIVVLQSDRCFQPDVLMFPCQFNQMVNQKYQDISIIWDPWVMVNVACVRNNYYLTECLLVCLEQMPQTTIITITIAMLNRQLTVLLTQVQMLPRLPMQFYEGWGLQHQQTKNLSKLRRRLLNIKLIQRIPATKRRISALKLKILVLVCLKKQCLPCSIPSNKHRDLQEALALVCIV